MASRRDDEIHGFLSRWSQRKRAAEESAEKAALDPGAAEEQAAAGQADPAGEATVSPEDLPDIESLDATSDFKVFMKQGVPSSLKRQALNKLWHSDPFFKQICMLDDYNLDYTDAAMVVPNLKTIYQVGKGMVLPDKPAPDKPAPEKPADMEVAEDRGAGEEPPQVTAQAPTAASEVPEGRPAVGVSAREGEPLRETGAENSSGESGKPSRPRAATPRPAAATPEQRSARRRRWGDVED